MSRRATPSGSTPAKPLRADAERNRQRIIAAAREVFAERGVEVTLDDIARHAGVGVGTVYRRFADREELIEAVFEDQVERLAEAAEEASRCEDPWTGLEQLLLVTGRHFADNRGLRDVLLEGTPDRRRALTMRERLTPAVTTVLTRAQQAGSLRDDIEVTDVPLIHIMLMATAEQGRSVTPDLWKRYLTLILDGLRQDRDRPTPLPQRALDQGEFDRAMR
ncbi:TetR/AcrR family transcriptional regulator [Streptomyces sp. NPDC059897]|uniref:TetR/AcrR family transcriptional regulator n=1 Tax=Streptomyces sp. NPDC059897 TaxID=3346994 RepID=UPI00364E1F36